MRSRKSQQPSWAIIAMSGHNGDACGPFCERSPEGFDVNYKNRRRNQSCGLDHFTWLRTASGQERRTYSQAYFLNLPLGSVDDLMSLERFGLARNQMI